MSTTTATVVQSFRQVETLAAIGLFGLLLLSTIGLASILDYVDRLEAARYQPVAIKPAEPEEAERDNGR